MVLPGLPAAQQQDKGQQQRMPHATPHLLKRTPPPGAPTKQGAAEGGPALGWGRRRRQCCHSCSVSPQHSDRTSTIWAKVETQELFCRRASALAARLKTACRNAVDARDVSPCRKVGHGVGTFQGDDLGPPSPCR
eukprot:scaffold1204_cov407-Prasinococcus_capsulatus_cf.AAC.5